jgi:hypothetical protein
MALLLALPVLFWFERRANQSAFRRAVGMLCSRHPTAGSMLVVA